MTDTHRYSVQVFWSDDDEGFIAIAPDLPGCSAFGETQGEALSQLQQAIAAWIEATRAAGNPVPEPSRPVVDFQHSGKVLLRMPRTLHTQLSQRAKAENVSLNHYIVFLLTSADTYRTVEQVMQQNVGTGYGQFLPSFQPNRIQISSAGSDTWVTRRKLVIQSAPGSVRRAGTRQWGGDG